MSMLARLGSGIAMYSAACYAERILLAPVLAKYLPAIVAPSALLGGLVTQAYGAVICINGKSCHILRTIHNLLP